MRPAVVLSIALLACDESNNKGPAEAGADRSREGRTAPSGDGCARTGALELIEADPACSVSRPSEDAMRDFAKRVSVEIVPETPTVVGGSGTTLRLTMTNIASTETTIVFEAFTRAPGPRPDWSRLAGVPDMKQPQADAARLHFVIATLDASGHNVDGLPTVVGTAVTPTPARILAVKVRPGGKLTQALSWWALRIPPPPPIVTDDAGHRFVTKTLATPLLSADYTISVELPLHGLAPLERTVTTTVHVDPAPQPKKPPPPPPPTPSASAVPESAPATPRGPVPSPPVLRPAIP